MQRTGEAAAMVPHTTPACRHQQFPPTEGQVTRLARPVLTTPHQIRNALRKTSEYQITVQVESTGIIKLQSEFNYKPFKSSNDIQGLPSTARCRPISYPAHNISTDRKGKKIRQEVNSKDIRNGSTMLSHPQ